METTRTGTVQEINDLDGRAEKLLDEGRYDEAIKILEGVKEIAERNLADEDETRLRVLCNLGYGYSVNGQHQQAALLLNDVLIVQRKFPERNPLSLALTLRYLGESYFNQSRLNEASAMLEECLAIQQKNLRPSDLRLAATMNVLGRCWMLQHKYSDSEKTLHDALKMRSAVLPPHHVDISDSQYTLSQCLRKQNKLAEAIKLITACLEIRKQSFPPLHPLVASAVGELGRCFKQAGRLEEAEEHFREELEIERQSLQEKHPHIATTLYNLGLCLKKRRKNREAEKLLREAVNIRSLSLSKNHPRKISALTLWAECLINIGDYGAAKKTLLDALHIINANELPKDHSQRSRAMLLLRRVTASTQPHAQSLHTASCEGRPAIGQTSERNQPSEAGKVLTDQEEIEDPRHAQSVRTVDCPVDVVPLSWTGGTLEQTLMACDVGAACHQIIGVEGGQLFAGSVSVSVPAGAVLSPTPFSAHTFLGTDLMPPRSDITFESSASPVAFISPHHVSFHKPIKLRLQPVISPPEPSYLLTLMRSKNLMSDLIKNWQQVVVYDTTSGHVQSHVPFDPDSWTVDVAELSCWCWVKRFLNPKAFFERKVNLAVFGQCLAYRQRKIIIHVFYACNEVYNRVRQRQLRYREVEELDMTRSIKIHRRGHLQITAMPSLWRVTSSINGEAKVTLPARKIWDMDLRESYRFQYEVESDQTTVNFLSCSFKVESVSGGVAIDEDLVELCHPLSSPTPLLSSEATRSDMSPDQVSIFRSPSGVLSSSCNGSVQLTSPAVMSSVSAAAISERLPSTTLHAGAVAECIDKCEVIPDHGFCDDEDFVFIRLAPSSCNVPQNGCVVEFSSLNGQKREQQRGCRCSSRLLETVQPAWPKAGTLEISVRKLDGYLIASGTRTILDVVDWHRMQENHSRQAAASQSSGRTTSHQVASLSKLELECPVTDLQILEVASVAGSKWLEIGIHLGFKLVKIKGYEVKHPDNMDKRLLDLLTDWVNQERRATVGMLLAACRKAKIEGAVEKALLELRNS